MIRLLIADDHPIIRDGLKKFFEMAGGIQVVGEAGNGTETLRAVGRGGFDVLLLDLTMPEPSGLELISLIRSEKPALPILVLSIHNAPIIVRHALKAGASGYVTKDCAFEELLDAIRHVSRGGEYLSPLLARHIGAAGDGGSAVSIAAKFTEVDFEILRLMGEGMGSHEIARCLHIDEDVAAAHVARLKRVQE